MTKTSNEVKKIKKKKLNSKDIIEALAKRYPLSEWLFVVEVILNGAQKVRRFDAVAMAYWPSREYVRHIYEVKVSRQDFLNEIRDPNKRDFALDSSEYFWFATPPGLVKKGELPPEAGLMEIEDGISKIIVPAPKRKVPAASPEFMLALSRRAVDAGKREVAAKKGIPGWHMISQLLEVSAGKRRTVNGPRRLFWAQDAARALRSGGYRDEALFLERISREGEIYDNEMNKAAQDDMLEKFKQRYPGPDICPDCEVKPERDTQSLTDFVCPNCKREFSAIKARKLDV